MRPCEAGDTVAPHRVNEYAARNNIAAALEKIGKLNF
jgi:hypothetical protein